jgi:sterol desaturase/sphingolipid hydroxylase (fatty acid hydroxylase superfamily)
LLVVGVPLLVGLELPVDREGLKLLFDRRFGLGALPGWVGAPLTLLALDLAGYAIHRLKHQGGLLWRIHAVHHSSESLDWLAAARSHPLDELTTTLLAVVPIVALGGRFEWLAWTTPLLALHGVLLHADVPWRYGRLGAWIVSPAFHRWHHARETPRAEGVNFGGIFTIWDRLFGTYHLPDRLPDETGVVEHVPEGFVAQLLHPLRRR